MSGYRIISAFGKFSGIQNSRHIVYIISNPTCENTHVYFFKSMEPCFVFNFFKHSTNFIDTRSRFFWFNLQVRKQNELIRRSLVSHTFCINSIFWRQFFGTNYPDVDALCMIYDQIQIVT